MSQIQRGVYLDTFNDTELTFGKVMDSKAWPVVFDIMNSGEKMGSTTHLFQVRHDWQALLKDQINDLVTTWGITVFGSYAPLERARAIRAFGESETRMLQGVMAPLSADEYLIRRSQLLKHGVSDSSVVKEPTAQQEPHLLLPYPNSFFEFLVNDTHWMVNVVQKDSTDAELKFYFYLEDRWQHATKYEYEKYPIFTLLKRQVIAALVVMETYAASAMAHEDAKPPKKPAVMKYMKEVLGKTFNHGYSVVDLTKRNSESQISGIPNGHRLRLHFRRSHWRVIRGVKKYVRWYLAGDPALGFVDKHYRL